MNSAISYAEQPSVHDVLARKPVNDVVALNTKAIAEAMHWILDHPAEAEAMGRRGRQTVERTCNWDAEAVNLLSLYKKPLN